MKTKSPETKKISASKKAPSAQKIIRLGLHNLEIPKGAHKQRRVLGRGPSSGHGKTSTRGSKGQTSRAGRHFYLGFEGGQSPLVRRFPKRGFTNIFKKEFQIVNLRDLERIKGVSTITADILAEKGIIKDKAKAVKILADGEIKNPINIKAQAFSKKAEDKIKAAGGSIEVISNV